MQIRDEASLFPITSDPVTPPLRWVGGKRWLVPALKVLWNSVQATDLCEPFMGGLAVAFGLRPQRAALSDFNRHVVNFYEHVAAGMSPNDIGGWPSLDAATFTSVRARFNELALGGGSATREAALLFYWLNRACYGGVCRFNKDGRFNVPFDPTGNYTIVDSFDDYASALAGWSIRHGDFRDSMPGAGSFLYVDPPYDDGFVGYNGEGFTWGDQLALADMIAAHDGPVVASNSATERIMALYAEKGFTVALLPSQRGFGVKAGEMFAYRGFTEAAGYEALSKVPVFDEAAPRDEAEPLMLNLFDAPDIQVPAAA